MKCTSLFRYLFGLAFIATLHACDNSEENSPTDRIEVGAVTVMGMSEFNALFKMMSESSDPAATLAQSPEIATAATVSGRSMLHTLARSGNVDAVNALLDAGVDVDLRDYEHTTALHRAVNPVTNAGPLQDRLQIIKILLDAGADPNAFGSSGTPTGLARYRAARYQELEAYQMLIEAGGDPDGLPEGVKTFVIELNMPVQQCIEYLDQGGYEKELPPSELLQSANLIHPVNPQHAYYFGMYGGWVLLETNPDQPIETSTVERIIVWHNFDIDGDTIKPSFHDSFELSRNSRRQLSEQYNKQWFDQLSNQ